MSAYLGLQITDFGLFLVFGSLGNGAPGGSSPEGVSPHPLKGQRGPGWAGSELEVELWS